MPAVTVSTATLPLREKSLMPSSQITADTPDSDSTSRSSRAAADGPPANGFVAEYSAGPTIWLPPIPALTTAILLPNARCSRRDNTSGQRSSPFMVVAVPSVMESPNATINRVSAGIIMSTASRKNHDAVGYGNAASSSAAPLAPASGAVTNEVVNPLACHVIGPLSPATWKLTASLRPASSGTSGSRTKARSTGSLHTDAPGATVTSG